MSLLTEIVVTEELMKSIGQKNRLDVFLFNFFKSQYEVSRSNIDKIIPSGVYIGDSHVKASYKVKVGDAIKIDIQAITGVVKEARQNVSQLFDVNSIEGSLDILFENQDFLVINKPAGIAMHPGAGTNNHPTLANYVRFYLESKAEFDPLVENSGVVHRLDKSVQGITIWAKNLVSQQELRSLFKQRLVTKVYKAEIEKINGAKDFLKDLESNEWHLISGFIHRDKTNRYRRQFIVEQFADTDKSSSLYLLHNDNIVYIKLVTGRNHQIRATLRSLGYFIKGDSLYSRFSSRAISIPEKIDLYAIFLSINSGRYNGLSWSIGLSEYETKIIEMVRKLNPS